VDWTLLPLARTAVDRTAHRRAEPDLIEKARARENTQVLLVSGSMVAVSGERLDVRSPADVPEWPLAFYLGSDGGVDVLAAVVDHVDAGGGGHRWANLRDVGYALDDRDAGLATAAVGLAQWHERHRCCSLCGEPTVPDLGGWVRRCPRDGSEHYPRTDPAVIVAVTDGDDRLLLARGAQWAERRFSTLAGFVESGESAERAVVREVAEEVSIPVDDVRYRGSQPWPFPASLMLAFTARARATEIAVDGVEVVEARWFTREELRRAVEDGVVLPPMRASVARTLIEEWFGKALPEHVERTVG
jgi:NAD+ diphosphatase